MIIIISASTTCMKREKSWDFTCSVINFYYQIDQIQYSKKKIFFNYALNSISYIQCRWTTNSLSWRRRWDKADRCQKVSLCHLFTFFFFPFDPGSCLQAGYTGCCTSGDCLGSPAVCFCHLYCHRTGSCCDDILTTCPSRPHSAGDEILAMHKNA